MRAIKQARGMPNVKMAAYLRVVFIVACLLAAVGPGLNVLGLLRARERARTITEFGPLPEIQVPWTYWLVLGASAMLIVAIVLELAGWRPAAPLALAATLLLWRYFAPGVWAHVAGDGYFEVAPGVSTSIPAQQIVHQIVATLCAVGLTCVRVRQRGSFG